MAESAQQCDFADALERGEMTPFSILAGETLLR